ncbi:hypothetical protein B5X24_HaOG207180 [Helicoverpa armigera]|nr:hypothetical protein B5X24_HaOG207180 [Helicoverpa armigera]
MVHLRPEDFADSDVSFGDKPLLSNIGGGSTRTLRTLPCLKKTIEILLLEPHLLLTFLQPQSQHDINTRSKHEVS